jgi:AcrR family transcriptional regulator
VETERRAYRLGARAAAVDETRSRIVEAAIEAFLADWYDEVTLRQVAKDAGVALATVVNHFGTKEQLFAAGVDVLQPRIEALRDSAPPDDLGAAVAIVVDHYEATGDAIIRALAMEDRVPALKPVLARGRRFHRAWVERVFAVPLAEVPSGARRRRAVAAYVAALDVYVWKRLRRDICLSRADTITVMHDLAAGLGTQRTEPSDD